MIESASALPRSTVSCTITARDHTFWQDKPAEFGGSDRGPMASELLLGSLLACQLSTFAKVAAKRRSEATVSLLRGDLVFDDNGDIEEIRLKWTVAGDEPSKVATLIRLTDQSCTISRVLSVPISSTFRVLA